LIFPYEIFEHVSRNQNISFASSLEFSNGYVRYRVPKLHSDIELQNANGKIIPLKSGLLKLDLKATMRGFLEGEVAIQGEVDTVSRTHRLEVHFMDVNFGKIFSIVSSA